MTSHDIAETLHYKQQEIDGLLKRMDQMLKLTGTNKDTKSHRRRFIKLKTTITGKFKEVGTIENNYSNLLPSHITKKTQKLLNKFKLNIQKTTKLYQKYKPHKSKKYNENTPLLNNNNNYSNSSSYINGFDNHSIENKEIKNKLNISEFKEKEENEEEKKSDLNLDISYMSDIKQQSNLSFNIDREERISNIHYELVNISDMINDLKEIVNDQDSTINTLEENTLYGLNDTKLAQKQLIKSHNKLNKSRKCKCFIFVFLFLVISIVILCMYYGVIRT